MAKSFSSRRNVAADMAQLIVALTRRSARDRSSEVLHSWRKAIRSCGLRFQALADATARLAEANAQLAEATHRMAACEVAARRLRGALSLEGER